MTATLPEGTIFAGRYRVGRRLAAGAMGAVYEAVHLDTDRRRALKVMHAHLFESDDMRERFQLEARIAARVESEFIVDVSDAGVDEATGMPFLVMELLRGEELGVRLKRLGRLPPDEVVTYLEQAAMALERTHAQSIIHRDLKPANLFLTHRDDGAPRIKILDFGVAKVIAEGARTAGSTQILGTPLYMAPEQFQSAVPLTAAVDIHALGMLAYTLLVGEPYWSAEARRGGGVIALAMIILRGPPEAATQRAAACGATLPPGFDAWFARITAVNPDHRFPGARAAIRALGEALHGATGTLPTVPVAPPSLEMSLIGAAASSQPSSSAALLERAGTSTGATMTAPPPPERSRRSLVVAASVTAGGALAAAVWLAVHLVSKGPVAAVVPAAAAASVVVEVEVAAAPAPSGIVPELVVTGAPALPPSTMGVEASAPLPPPAIPRPAPAAAGGSAKAASAPVPAKKPVPRLFGRD